MKKIAIITGAGAGMGREFLKEVSNAERFDEIWAISRNADRLSALKEETGLPVRPVPMDLTKEENYKVLREMLESEEITVSLLANISGYGKMGETWEIPLSEILGMIDLNCKALTALTHIAVPYMEKGGKILEFGSISAFQPVPYLNTYAATKAYVVSFTKGLSAELRNKGIRVMTACPYWVDTGFFGRAKTEGGSDKYINNFEVMYKPDDVAKKTVHDLYKTRKTVSVYGGYAKFVRMVMKIMPSAVMVRLFLKMQKIK